MKAQRKPRAKFWRVAVLLALCLLVGLVGGAIIPWGLGPLSSHSQPVHDYAESVQRVHELDAGRTGAMNPVCHAQLMTHGQKVAQAIVLVHGYTNCPEQFHLLGQKFYNAGYNVLIAPLPHHGLADRMTNDLSQLTAVELAAYADQVVDIAHGLGAKVVMIGISGGGVVTAWAAQNRSDLDEAVIISPAFGYKQIPTLVTAPAMNIVSMLPDSYSWWDPELKMDVQPSYAYPRYSMHGLAELLRLGFSVQVAARRVRPAAGMLIVITNGNEPSVNNALTEQVVSSWRGHGANLSTYEFPADLHLPHDLISPSQLGARIDLVYSRLLELVAR